MTEQMTFYEVLEDGELAWVAAQNSDGIYGYLPNTRRWHRNAGLEEARYGLAEDDIEFREISREEARKLMKRAPRIDGRSWRYLLERFKEQVPPAVLSSAEVGVGAATESEIRSALRAKQGGWVPIKTFPGGQIHRARVFRSDLRNGKSMKRVFEGRALDDYEIRVVGTDPVRVEIRALPTAEGAGGIDEG